jgi:protoheme IX farnesyltransferase
MSTSAEKFELPEPFVDVAVAPSAVISYYELTKPRMNFLVVLTTFAGFYMASTGPLDLLLLLHTIIGTGLTAAGASVLNQYFERDFDALMPRTKGRPLPAGHVPPSHAMTFGAVLGTAGVVYLAALVNPLTAGLGFATLASYVWVYTPLKRRTTLNTVIGAVPGALPPVMGFTAVAGALSPEALALFGILFFWQLPHFLAIAILYRKDYAAGGFLMLPVVDESLDLTSRQILLWGAALVPVSLLPTMLGMSGALYFGAATLLGLAFFTFGISCAVTKTRTDARKLFFASIIYLPMLLVVMGLDKAV